MKILNPSQSLILATTIFLLLAIPLRAQDSPQDFSAVHNRARAAVGVDPLIWDEEVAAYARNYANKRKYDCFLIHSVEPYGQNIALDWGNNFTGVEAVNLWVSEKDEYDYDSNTCTLGVSCLLHYTQVVWRNSLRLGCAKVICNDDRTFITCNYDPRGNYIGQKLQALNVCRF